MRLGRFTAALKDLERVTEIDERRREPRPAPDRLPIGGLGIVVTTLIKRQQAQAIPGLRKGGIDRHGPMKMFPSLVEPAEDPQRFPQVRAQPS